MAVLANLIDQARIVPQIQATPVDNQYHQRRDQQHQRQLGVHVQHTNGTQVHHRQQRFKRNQIAVPIPTPVDNDQEAGIGWNYSDGTFIAPSEPEEAKQSDSQG